MQELKKEPYGAFEILTPFPAAREKEFLRAYDLTEQ
jgi:hypothetical protein